MAEVERIGSRLASVGTPEAYVSVPPYLGVTGEVFQTMPMIAAAPFPFAEPPAEEEDEPLFDLELQAAVTAEAPRTTAPLSRRRRLFSRRAGFPQYAKLSRIVLPSRRLSHRPAQPEPVVRQAHH